MHSFNLVQVLVASLAAANAATAFQLPATSALALRSVRLIPRYCRESSTNIYKGRRSVGCFSVADCLQLARA